MSGTDENDFVKNGVDSITTTGESSIKSAVDAHVNGDDAIPAKSDNLNTKKSSSAPLSESTIKNNELNASAGSTKPSTPSNWVQFGNEDDANNTESTQKYAVNSPTSSSAAQQASSPPPVLTTESVHINIKNLPANQSSTPAQKSVAASSPAVIEIPTPSSLNKSFSAAATPNEQGLRTIELSSGRVREGFANGDVIVTLLPINTRWPWITPACFRPELVPEELMAQGLTLTVEEYVHAMETLVNDFRFTLYNVCYKRVLLVWVLFAFCVLLGMLFSGLKGIALFSIGVGWLFLNAAAIFMCMWIKLRLARGLERCLASVNKQLLRHKIILALDDRGRMSCHKVNLCFMYYDPEQCVNYLNDFIERSEQNGTMIEAGWESRLDVDVNDIVIQGSNTTRVSRKQAVGELLFLRYLQRWGKDYLRRRLDWIFEEQGIHEMPRHLQSSLCPCQYAEELIINKPRKDHRACCPTCNDWMNSKGISIF